MHLDNGRALGTKTMDMVVSQLKIRAALAVITLNISEIATIYRLCLYHYRNHACPLSPCHLNRSGK